MIVVINCVCSENGKQMQSFLNGNQSFTATEQ